MTAETVRRLLAEAERELVQYDKAVLGGGVQCYLEDLLKLSQADFRNIQLYDVHSKTLWIAAQKIFNEPFLDYFARIQAGDGSACGTALARRERVVIEDVDMEVSCVPTLAVLREAGVRAVQSTPLVDGWGQPVGMISTHFRIPHRFSDRECSVVDQVAKAVVEFLLSSRSGTAWKPSR